MFLGLFFSRCSATATGSDLSWSLPVVVEDIELGSRHDTRPGAEIDVVQEMTMQLAPMFARSEQLTSQRAVASSSVLSPTRSNWDNTLSTETPGGTQHSV